MQELKDLLGDNFFIKDESDKFKMKDKKEFSIKLKNNNNSI